jgi:hypothetical protein
MPPILGIVQRIGRRDGGAGRLLKKKPIRQNDHVHEMDCCERAKIIVGKAVASLLSSTTTTIPTPWMQLRVIGAMPALFVLPVRSD